MSAYEIAYHPEAERDLWAIFTLIEGYAGTGVAERKLAEIERVVKGLASYPHIGSTRDNIRHKLRAIPAAEKAVVCFTVDDDTHMVDIICISYAGSDWMSQVSDRL